MNCMIYFHDKKFNYFEYPKLMSGSVLFIHIYNIETCVYYIVSGGEACIISAAGSIAGPGSDIGGSIRMPACFNGIFGHKPTSGEYSPLVYLLMIPKSYPVLEFIWFIFILPPQSWEKLQGMMKCNIGNVIR